MSTSVAIYVFPDVEVLDFAGPYEVFTTASRVFKRLNPASDDLFRVLTVSKNQDAVRARAGLTVLPDRSFLNCTPTDVLIIPGGVVDKEVGDAHVIEWVRNQAARAMITASVCTGAFILAKAGLLEGRSATTHWEDIADLQAHFGNVHVREGARWIDEGSIVTSAGIAAGIDMSLHLVSRIAGKELAVATARQMEVPYSAA
jgi:transcriptional regulator GlxA family with amidase domain